VWVEGKNLDQKRGLSLPVDLVRTVAMVLVIVLHAASEPHSIVTQVTQAEVWRWWTVNIYDTVSRTSAPIFVMLSGALLLQPSKIEPLGVFFRKRFNRIGLPFLFWGSAYFVWRFFVNHEALSVGSIVQGILSGPYYHFWYLYMLVGLYLLTPILRIVVAYGNRKILKYFLLVWFMGPAIVPLPALFGAYNLESNVFTIPWWAGYFLLGAYLLAVRMRRAIQYILLFFGFALTAVGTYIVTLIVGGRLSLFFQDYFSPTTILASVALLLLLYSVQAPSDRIESQHPKTSWLLSQISQNTLPIYLFHPMILESLQKGYFGFKISINTLNPAIEIPLITAVTLFICLGLIIPSKKMPGVKRAIG